MKVGFVLREFEGQGSVQIQSSDYFPFSLIRRSTHDRLDERRVRYNSAE